MDTFLRLPAVMAATGLGRSTIYQKVARGEFPAPRRISARTVVWLASEVADWQKQRLAEPAEPALSLEHMRRMAGRSLATRRRRAAERPTAN